MSRRKRALAPTRRTVISSAAKEPGRTAHFRGSSVRQAVVVLVAVKVVGLVLLFDPASSAPFDGAKAAFSLATSAALAGLIAALLLRFDGKEYLRNPLHVAAALFGSANVVAVVFAQDQYIAVFGAQRRGGLTFVADMLVLYVAVSLAFRTWRDWGTAAAAAAASGAAAIGYGGTQALGLDPIPWVDSVRARPPSTFGNPDKFGHFLGAAFAVALAVAVLPGSGTARRTRLLALALAAASFLMFSIVATRGTIVGLAVALPTLAALYIRASRTRLGRRSVLAGSGALLALVVFGGATVVATPLGDRVRAGLSDAASQQRLFVADAAYRAFLDRPLTGHGPDNFGAIYPRYRPQAASAFVGQDSAHSSLLQSAATTGLFGVLGLVTVAAVSLALLWRAGVKQSAVAGPLLVGGAAYWANGLVAVGSVSADWIGWFVAGAAVAISHPVDLVARRNFRPLVEWVVVGSGLLAGLAALPAHLATREHYLARTAKAPAVAAGAAERAVRLDSGRSEYWFALGRSQHERGAPADAARAFRAAADRAPYVSANWTNLALALAQLSRAGDRSLGGADAAMAAARRGVEADPNFPSAHHVLALVATTFGDHALALDASATAVSLFKGEPEYDRVAVDAAARLPDAAAARQALERIVTHKDSAVLRVGLAQTSLRLNDVSSARAHLRRALELDPQNAAAVQLARQLGP